MKHARLIWKLNAVGNSPWMIANELNRRLIPSIEGRNWHHDAIKRVLDLTADEFASGTRDSARRFSFSVRVSSKAA